MTDPPTDRCNAIQYDLALSLVEAVKYDASQPLGMKDSFFFPDAARIPRIAML